jgi:hypothetical protein
MASLSIFRGQSRVGIGEGPGRPIVEGEQYLAADPPLGERAELLQMLRPWLTLDAEPDDHRQPGAQLEAWSCLNLGGWTLVCRLVPAGTFDRRAAYFAHARLWPKPDLAAGVDPGLLLGRSDAFAAPWRDGQRGAAVEVPVLGLVRPQQVAAAPDTAARLLASLYHALRSGRVLLIAVPVTELVAGAPLLALLGFARAVLPAALKERVKVRSFTRQPAAFLRLGANVLVLPEELAAPALSLAREALLLDREARLVAGAPPPPDVIAYAETLARRANERPEDLVAFVERWEASVAALPEPARLAALRLADACEDLQAADEATRDRGRAQIDQLMMDDPEGASAALAASGWWGWWRWRSALPPPKLREAARGWLVAPCWLAPEAPEATLETWEQALADLAPEGLDQAEVAILWQRGRHRWPAIPPFELEQLEGLAGIAGDSAARQAFIELASADPALEGHAEVALREHLLAIFPDLQRAALSPRMPAEQSDGDQARAAESPEEEPVHDRITLFYRRQPGAAQPRLQPATLDGRPAQALLWTFGAARPTETRATKRRARALDPAIEELERELADAGGGLLVAAPRDCGAQGPLRIAVVPGSGRQPAGRLLSLRPGTPPSARTLANGLFWLEPDEHLLLPVDRTAEEQLAKLNEGLAWLPREVAAHLYETITRFPRAPAEASAAMVPARLPMPSAADGIPGPPAKWRSWLARPVRAGVLLVALLLALALGGVALAIADGGRRLDALETTLRRLEREVERIPVAGPAGGRR